MDKELSRRSFLKVGTTAALGLAVAPSMLSGKSKKKVAPAPLDRKLKILGVGIGGRGSAVLRGVETEEIIGLCDVDWKYAAPVFERYPNAKRYTDYRKMYAELLDEADAVVVATADHTHAIIAAEADAAVAKIAADSAEYQGQKDAAIMSNLGEMISKYPGVIDYYYTQNWNGELPDTYVSDGTLPVLNLN